jgi:ankyrin repeat protein
MGIEINNVLHKQFFDAVLTRNRADVMQLINTAVNINEQNESGDTALHLAVRSDNDDLVEILLNAEANVNIQNNDGDTALHLAAFGNYIIIAEKIMAHGANLTIKNNKNLTATELNHSISGYGIFDLVFSVAEESEEGLNLDQRIENDQQEDHTIFYLDPNEGDLILFDDEEHNHQQEIISERSRNAASARNL